MKSRTFQTDKCSIRNRRPYWIFSATVNTVLSINKKNSKKHRFQGGS